MPKKVTHEQFEQEIKKVHGDNIVLLEKYTSARNKILVRCKCGNEWSPMAYSLKKHGCAICGIKKRAELKTIPHDTFVNRVKELLGNEYEILSEYKGVYEQVSIFHKVCGLKYERQAYFLLNKRGCPECGEVKRRENKTLTLGEIKNKIFNLVGNEYIVIFQTKKGSRGDVRIKHSICGNEYNVRPTKFFSGNRCPFCHESNGESRVRSFLEINNIQFKKQYYFEDCVHVLPLKFDFAVFENGKLKVLIEYDGQQHFDAKELYGGEEGLKKTKLRDSIKNEYCKKNEIPLIRISYKDENKIEEILTKKLLNARTVIS